MFRLALIISFAVLLSILPGGYAGPACTRKYYQTANCIQKCQTRWGYPGSRMGSNPWGVVVQKVDNDSKADLKSAIAEACGMSGSTTSSKSKSKSKEIEDEEDDDAPKVVGGVEDDPDVEETSVDDTDDAPLTLNTLPASTSTTTTKKPTPTPESKTLPTKAALVATKPKPTPTPPPKPKPKPQPTDDNDNNNDNDNDNGGGGSGSSNQGGDIGQYLKGHNDFRAKHGATALTWNDNLASKAQQWANRCQFVHSGGTLGKFGENLAAGTGGGYGIASAIKSWTDEVKDYNSKAPQASHFTQVVWKDTKQVGCALQLCDGIFDAKFGKAKYVVCEYDPPGNFNNDFARNVQV